MSVIFAFLAQLQLKEKLIHFVLRLISQMRFQRRN